MDRKRKVFTALSITIAFVSCLLFIVYRVLQRSIPLWDDLFLAFGLVFVCTLLFDRIGQQTAQFRNEKEATSVRPSTTDELRDFATPIYHAPRVAPISSQVLYEQVSLKRVEGAASRTDFLTMFDVAADELNALDAKRSADIWLRENGDIFYIFFEGTLVGFCLLEMMESRIHIKLIYVQSAYRRRAIGSSAYRKLMAFIQVLGGVTNVYAECSAHNMRGQRFYQSLGFHECEHIGMPNPDGTTAWTHPL